MKILEANKVREADDYTIKYEPIDSINLMERAAWRCCDWIFGRNYKEKKIRIFSGPGNNGGDGLAIARILADGNYQVDVTVLEIGSSFSDDFTTNYQRLEGIATIQVCRIKSEEDFPEISDDEIVIDALFGSGLSRPLVGLAAKTVEHINGSGAKVISIDIPSGLFGEDNYLPFRHVEGDKPIVKADFTLTFEFPFLSFFFPENDKYVGKAVVIPIGIHRQFIENLNTRYETIESNLIRKIFRQRKKFSHKGTFGHAISIAGSYGKIGAAILASRAALRSGLGLLTAHFPHLAYHIMQTSVPEAIASIDQHEYHISQLPELADYSAVGIGPGIGKKNATRTTVAQLLEVWRKPIVIDADGLNIIAEDLDLMAKLPKNSILTPHPKEFERLFGKTNGAYHRLEVLCRLAQEREIIIVLKGAHTTVALPTGQCYFNTTGNPGMATAGSGDTLFGIILSLLAQAYPPKEAALLGVYIHGLAGDIAAAKRGQSALIAGDIIEHLGDAFLQFEDN